MEPHGLNNTPMSDTWTHIDTPVNGHMDRPTGRMDLHSEWTTTEGTLTTVLSIVSDSELGLELGLRGVLWVELQGATTPASQRSANTTSHVPCGATLITLITTHHTHHIHSSHSSHSFITFIHHIHSSHSFITPITLIHHTHSSHSFITLIHHTHDIHSSHSSHSFITLLWTHNHGLPWTQIQGVPGEGHPTGQPLDE